MDFKSMKASIAIVIAIVAQAFGVIWYIAQMDSMVKNLDATVATMQESQATVDVAVLQTTVEGLKEKLDSMEVFDSSDLEEAIEELDEAIASLDRRSGIIENEMRTIMSDHGGFADVLQQLELSGVLPSGEKRAYGNYGGGK
jgi:FtsZ-binding cell division protein ZapB